MKVFLDLAEDDKRTQGVWGGVSALLRSRGFVGILSGMECLWRRSATCTE